MTARQKELLDKEDWRSYAISLAGTGLGAIATVEKVSKKHLGFALPSAPALYISLARQARARRQSIDIDAAFVVHPEPQGTYPEDHKPVFDFLESFMAEVVFSFTAIEAFANESIPQDFKYEFKKAKETKTLPRAEIERQVSLDEKLKRVLPQAYGIKSPAGTKPWEHFKELKDVRDRLIHMKSVDRRPSGPEHQTVWGLLLSKKSLDCPKVALEIIGSFESLVSNRRWFQLASSSLKK